MEGAILNLINSAFGVSVALAFVVIGLVIYGVYKIGQFSQSMKEIKSRYLSIKEDFLRTEKSIKDDFSRAREESKNDIERLAKKLDTIASAMATAAGQTVAANSPLALTQMGREIAKEIDLEDMVNSHWTKIQKTLNNQSLSNPYDMQTAAMSIAENCFNELFNQVQRDKIKSMAYSKGISMLHLYPIIGIIIRDRYLEENGHAIEEVDVHDPQKTA